MPIPVIIPFYKNRRQLDLCMAALGKQDTPVEAWIYDNSVENIYISRAFNVGLKRAISIGAELAILCTQDVYMRPDAATQGIKFMREHPRCAIAGTKQLLAANEDEIVHAGCLFAFPGGWHIRGKVSRGDCAASAPMPWVNGACIFVRMSAVAEFGLMDENLLMLGLDADWCYTARARGWEVWYCAESVVIHEEGVSTSKPPELKAIFDSDMAHFRNKWIGTELHDKLFRQFATPDWQNIVGPGVRIG